MQLHVAEQQPVQVQPALNWQTKLPLQAVV
jgi:hypothetical protein